MVSYFHNLYMSMYDKTNKMIFAPSEDSDQPGHPPSLIRVFACAQWVANLPKLSSCGQRRLWSDWAKTLIRLGGCPGWSEFSLGAQTILLVLSLGGWYYICSGRTLTIHEWQVLYIHVFQRHAFKHSNKFTGTRPPHGLVILLTVNVDDSGEIHRHYKYLRNQHCHVT